MTKALATFVKASYPPASRGIRGPSFAGEKVVASRSTLKWMSCGKAVVCSHAATTNEGRARKAFADYLVSADAMASDAEDADD
jgi:hypothetical protein